MLGALAEPQFRLLWIGQTTSAAGDALVPVAVAFAVLRIGGGAAELGIVFSSFTVSRVALVLAGGVWADRLPRQLVMVGCDVIRAVFEVGLAVLLLTGTAQLWHLALGAAVIGGAGAFFVPASSGLIPQTVTPGRLQQANALMGLSRTSTSILGPPIAGLVIAMANIGVIFLIDAATFVVSAASLLLLRPNPPQAGEREQQHFLAELAEGWREVVSRRWILAAICAFAITNLATGPFFILGPVIADEKLGGAASWGLILTGAGVGGVIGGLLALRLHPARPLRVGFVISTLMSLPAFALAGPMAVVAIAAALMISALVAELSNTWWFTMLQQHVPDRARSRVSSYDWLVSLVFNPLGFMLVGPLSLAIGAAPTLIGAACLCLAGNLAVLLVRDVRDVRWVEEAEPAAA
jgi:MFS family permease